MELVLIMVVELETMAEVAAEERLGVILHKMLELVDLEISLR